MDLALSQWQRTPGLLVTKHLDEGRTPLRLHRSRQQRPPNYQCNADTVNVEVLPTIVSFPKSNNFKDGRAGVLYDSARNSRTEPNADERERLLGYTTGTTAAPGLTEADRFKLTGQCMDANQLRAILYTALALDDVLPSLLDSTSTPYSNPPTTRAMPPPTQQPAIADTDWTTYPLTQTQWAGGRPCDDPLLDIPPP
jgi:hypothetical protein